MGKGAPVSAKTPTTDFEEARAFHGHVCGGLAIGFRASEAAMAWLGMQRAEDEELVAVVENDSCAVDAVQVVTGCTFGKGNLVFLDHGKMVLTLWDRRGGRGVRVTRRTSARGLSPEQILAAASDALLELRPAVGEIPRKARIHESEPCALCGEPTMVTRLEDTPRGLLCIPCARRIASTDPSPRTAR